MIVFLLEEPSMAVFLKEILPRICLNERYMLLPHQGKGDLMRSIPVKLKGWTMPGTKFVIVHDQDTNDCMQLKKSIEDLCRPYNKRVLIRIACRELESWYFGDLDAVEKAYNVNLVKLKNSARYRIPDDILDPKEVLRRFVPQLTQIDGARRISKYMDIENNRSHSFRVFVDGLKMMAES